MKVPGKSCSAFLMSRPWVTRFSSRSARGRRTMGSGGRGVSICPATWTASLPAGSGLSTRSPRPSSPRERRDSAFVRRKLELLSSCGYRRCCLFAPAELAAIGPYTVQDHRQLAGDRYACARHAAALGNVHPPSPQSRPFGATDQQRMGCLVQRGSSQLVAAPADPTLHV